jgi:hypothetical protein
MLLPGASGQALKHERKDSINNVKKKRRKKNEQNTTSS